MPHELATACRAAVDGLARAAKSAGEDRPLGMLRTGALADLVLRPWDDREPVTAQLTVTAPLDALTPARFLADGGPAPAAWARPGAVAAPTGEVDGQPITAAHLRELLAQLDAVCPGGLQAPTGGTLTVALTDAAGGLLATTTRAEIERLARRGCPTHPDGKCGCPLLGRPPATDAYAPTAAQRRWLQTRDHTCRHPGCAGRPGPRRRLLLRRTHRLREPVLPVPAPPDRRDTGGGGLVGGTADRDLHDVGDEAGALAVVQAIAVGEVPQVSCACCRAGEPVPMSGSTCWNSGRCSVMALLVAPQRRPMSSWLPAGPRS
ncbi:hypothetical protein ACI79D_16575 [Geodermatophilus sp. SYSU D00708]